MKGLRNGLYYGGKVRLVHSVVMTLLFKDINRHNIKQIVKMTMEHALNLGKFVFLYKSAVILMEKLYKKTTLNNFIAGTLCSYLVWREKTPVSYQIALYLFSRIIVGLVDMLYRKLTEPHAAGHHHAEQHFEKKIVYPIFVSLIWGITLWIFEVDKSSLQASLTSSLEFLYKKSDEPLRNWREMVPFYIPSFGSSK